MAPLEGPIGIGALVDAILLGCAIVQSCVYYRNSRGDSWVLKVLVSLFLFLLLSHLGCTAAWLWASAKVNGENTSVPNYASIVFGISCTFGAVIVFFERCFFSHRVLKLTNNHFLAFIFLVFCIFSLTAALGQASVFFTNATASLMNQLRNPWIFPLVVISGLVCDLAISFTTLFYLRSETLMEPADAMGLVTRLPPLVAETNCVTSLFDIIILIVYWLTKSNFAWVGLIVATPGVFTNALLAALNARNHLHVVDIGHQRALQIGDNVIDGRPKRPPIVISVIKRTESRSEKNPGWRTGSSGARVFAGDAAV